jgi:hypothetical protein
MKMEELIKKRVVGQDELFRTGLFLANMCSLRHLGFHLESYEVHRVPSIYRYFHALSGSNGHSKRALVERVFVAIKL